MLKAAAVAMIEVVLLALLAVAVEERQFGRQPQAVHLLLVVQAAVVALVRAVQVAV